MGILLDTCTWIAVEDRRIAPEQIAGLAGGARWYVSPVVLAELRTGELLLPSAPARASRRTLLADLRRLPLLAIDDATATTVAVLMAAILQRGGNPRRRANDLWLAAQCIQHDFALVTGNPADFADLPGLKRIALEPL